MNNDEKALENLSATIILVYWLFNNSPNDQIFSVVPSIANRPKITTGTIAFLKLKISAIRQKTPKPDIAINVFIFY